MYMEQDPMGNNCTVRPMVEKSIRYVLLLYVHIQKFKKIQGNPGLSREIQGNLGKSKKTREIQVYPVKIQGKSGEIYENFVILGKSRKNLGKIQGKSREILGKSREIQENSRKY